MVFLLFFLHFYCLYALNVNGFCFFSLSILIWLPGLTLKGLAAKQEVGETNVPRQGEARLEAGSGKLSLLSLKGKRILRVSFLLPGRSQHLFW